ncbi:MAG: hypothetical protein V8S92_01180 [Oscillospiraceae bacterium]
MQNINVEVTVVTKILSPEMEHEILVDLHRGITRMDGIGEYTGDPVHVFYISSPNMKLEGFAQSS